MFIPAFWKGFEVKEDRRVILSRSRAGKWVTVLFLPPQLHEPAGEADTGLAIKIKTELVSAEYVLQ